jgi:50S ribosomal protein 6
MTMTTTTTTTTNALRDATRTHPHPTTTITMAMTIGTPMTFTVRAARHPRKKATKGHTANRPKKLRPSDRNRTPVSYPEVNPADVPAVMTVLSK